MAIKESFHKNVFLLMQIVPASCECTKYFKKEMFDKPNTLGFIHISHYLLSVHNAERFQKMVIWPILNKMDEKRYRIEVQRYLEVLAIENPDLNFPSILKSHLLQATGTKFLTLMWKISQISLRAYITRTCHIELLQAPTIGDNKDIILIYFTTINIKRHNTISKFYEETKLILESCKHYMQCKNIYLAEIRISIFEVKKNIEKFISILPVNPLVVKRLIDIDDTEIINLWKKSINQNIKFLQRKNSELKELKNLSNKLYNLILNTCVQSKFFDGNDLSKLNIETLPLYLIKSNQHFNNGLYMNGCLVFQTLFAILHQVLKQTKCYLKGNKLIDLSNWESEIIKHCETMKSMKEIFQKLILQISDDLYDMQYSLQQKTIDCKLYTNTFYPLSLEIILSSPKFNFSIDEYIDDEKILKQTSISPLQGKYRHLFKRYKSNLIDLPESSTKHHFNDNIGNAISNWKSPQTPSLIYKHFSNKMEVPPKYSKLFSRNNCRKSYFKDNNATSTPNAVQKNVILKTSNTQTPNPQQMENMDIAMKNIFDLSCKITDVASLLHLNLT